MKGKTVVVRMVWFLLSVCGVLPASSHPSSINGWDNIQTHGEKKYVSNAVSLNVLKIS